MTCSPSNWRTYIQDRGDLDYEFSDSYSKVITLRLILMLSYINDAYNERDIPEVENILRFSISPEKALELCLSF